MGTEEASKGLQAAQVDPSPGIHWWTPTVRALSSLLQKARAWDASGDSEEDEEHRVALRDTGRWLGLVTGMWILSCAGSSATYAIYSPVLKSVGGYNQQQIDSLAVAKDMGESVGLLPGLLCDWLPVWGLLLSGSLHYLVGFSILWAVASTGVAPLPFAQMWVFMLVGSQGTAWFNTAVLVTSVRNFPRSRGAVVGLLKGLVGLSGAIFAQAYTALLAPNQAKYLGLIAVLPGVVSVPAMLCLRPVNVHGAHSHRRHHHHVSPEEQLRQESEERSNLNFILTVCLLLSAYLLGTMLLQDAAASFPRWANVGLLVGMVTFLIIPLFIPLRHLAHSLHRHSLSAVPDATVDTALTPEAGPPALKQDLSEAQEGGEPVLPGREELVSGVLADGEDIETGEESVRQALSRCNSYDSLLSDISHVSSFLDFQAMAPQALNQPQLSPQQQQQQSDQLSWLKGPLRQLGEKGTMLLGRKGSNRGRARFSEDMPREVSTHRSQYPKGTGAAATSSRGKGGIFEPLLPSTFQATPSPPAGLAFTEDSPVPTSSNGGRRALPSPVSPAVAQGLPNGAESVGSGNKGDSERRGDGSSVKQLPALETARRSLVFNGLAQGQSPSGQQTAPTGDNAELEAQSHSHSWPRPSEQTVMGPRLGSGAGTESGRRSMQSHLGLSRQEANLLLAVGEGAVKVGGRRRKGPRRGEDFTLAQASVKADFWLLFFSFAIGCGSGLTAINNLAQMGLAQGHPNVRIYVSLISICNFLGRLLAGYVSEHVVKDYALPRPVMLVAAQGLMLVGHIVFAIAFPWGSLAVGSTLVGLAYGVHWSIMPATASELFGLKHFGMIYNTLTMACPAASFVFSGLIAGYLYDREANLPSVGSTLLGSTTLSGPRVLSMAPLFGESVGTAGAASFTSNSSTYRLTMSQLAWGPLLLSDSPAAKECFGAHCFRLTFIIMAASCAIAMLLSFILYWRTRPVYATLYTQPLKRQLEQAVSRQQQHQHQHQQSMHSARQDAH